MLTISWQVLLWQMKKVKIFYPHEPLMKTIHRPEPKFWKTIQITISGNVPSFTKRLAPPHKIN